jgi:hypothetical protein
LNRPDTLALVGRLPGLLAIMPQTLAARAVDLAQLLQGVLPKVGMEGKEELLTIERVHSPHLHLELTLERKVMSCVHMGKLRCTGIF